MGSFHQRIVGQTEVVANDCRKNYQIKVRKTTDQSRFQKLVGLRAFVGRLPCLFRRAAGVSLGERK